MGSSINLGELFQLIPHKDMQFHRETVADLLGRNNTNFPGAQPVSFAREHLTELRNVDYFVCEKTDGIRCLLFLTHFEQDEGGEMEAQFLIDRKNDYYYVPNDSLHIPRPDNFPAEFHRRTLLDGELVRQRFKDGRPEQLAYLIFDCLALDGVNVMDKPFDKRLARVHENIWKPFQAFAKQYPGDVAAQPFKLAMKKMEFPYAMEMMFRETIPKLPHGNDGLIFTRKDAPYTPGTDRSILKWKYPKENTIDFRVLIGLFPTATDEEGEYEDWDAKPTFDLQVNHGGDGGYKHFDNLTVTDAEWEAVKRQNQMIDGRIIECYYDTSNAAWRPKIDEPDGTPRFRDDKKDANHIDVVDNVRRTIDDNVTEDDLVRQAGSVKVAFKARQKAREDDAKRAAEEEKVRRASVANVQKDEIEDGPTYED